jgi:hypothetical protein
MNKVLYAALIAVAISCGSKEEKTESSDSLNTGVVDSLSNDSISKQPTMTVEEKEVPAQILMVMEDSAKTPEEIGQKLGAIFGKIGECAGKCKMEGSGPPIAWYNGPKAPWTFVAGMPYTTKCAHPEAGISTKEIKAGKAVVVHFFGPYEMSEQAYIEGEKYLKEKGLTPSGPPYEVYVGDPELEKDPFKVQTDIVFPL